MLLTGPGRVSFGVQWLLAYVMLMSACAPQSRYVHYDALRNRIVMAPTHARTGDSIFLLSYDTLYGTKWSGKHELSDAVVGARFAVEGAVDVAKLAAGIPEGVRTIAHATETSEQVMASIAAATKPVTDAVLAESRRQFGPRALRDFLQRAPDARIIEFQGSPSVQNAQRREFDALKAIRDTAALLACGKARGSIARWVIAAPERSAYFAFVLNKTLPATLDAMLSRNAAGIEPEEYLNDVSVALRGGAIDTKGVDTLRAHGMRWSRSVAALSLLAGGDKGAEVGASDELKERVGALQVCLEGDERLAVADVASAHRALVAAWKRVDPLRRAGLDTTWAPIPRESILGFDIDPLFDVKHERRAAVEALFVKLARVAIVSRRLEEAIRTVPSFTVNVSSASALREDVRCLITIELTPKSPCDASRAPHPDTTFLGVFWKPNRLTITPVKGERWPTVTFLAAAAAVAPHVTQRAPASRGTASPDVAASTTRGTGGTAEGKGTGGDASGKEDDKKEKSAASPPQVAGTERSSAPTSPSVVIDVLQPARFQLSIGLTRSHLSTSTYAVIDTAEGGVPGTRIIETGVNRRRSFAMLALSYYVLPTRGKVFAAQAYANPRAAGNSGKKFAKFRKYVEQAGVAATIGLALDAPLERIFYGVTSEPLPGITVSAGAHSAYVQVPAEALVNGSRFIPDDKSLSPIPKRWQGPAFAWSVGVDPGVVLGAFGKVIGLK